ncbi:unnamed protein product, partial [Polarella glacialis]
MPPRPAKAEGRGPSANKASPTSKSKASPRRPKKKKTIHKAPLTPPLEPEEPPEEEEEELPLEEEEEPEPPPAWLLLAASKLDTVHPSPYVNHRRAAAEELRDWAEEVREH